jgi:hypothetical protein
MTDEVQICNLALQKLGEDNRITSLGDNTKAARELSVAYEPMRDAELRRHPWKFALRRADLAALAAAPDPSVYDYQYLLPADFLKLLDLPDYKTPYPTAQEQYQFGAATVGTVIETSLGSPLRIRYVAKITETQRFDPLFVQVLACSIAMQVCETITQSSTKKQLIGKEYEYWIGEAEGADAIEKPPQSMLESSWIMERN